MFNGKIFMRLSWCVISFLKNINFENKTVKLIVYNPVFSKILNPNLVITMTRLKRQGCKVKLNNLEKISNLS